MRKHKQTYGYYHIKYQAKAGGLLLRSNSERAFIISQLQDLLSPRLLLNSVPAHVQLASCVDLLAFSIKQDSVHLIIFSIDQSIVDYLARCILSRLQQFQIDLRPTKSNFHHSPDYKVNLSVDKLTGPHQALNTITDVHLRHEDWENDRYSSIGFYLHDRRGDWMRTWRLAQLYENKPENYLELIHRAQGTLSNHNITNPESTHEPIGSYRPIEP